MRDGEKKHIDEALKKCGYPGWAISRGSAIKKKDDTRQTKDRTDDTRKTMVGVPYVKDLSEES